MIKVNGLNQYDMSNMYKNTIDVLVIYSIINQKLKQTLILNIRNATNRQDFSHLGECKTPPFATYTRTFTNSFDSCI
jgi:hypothetical protein